MSVPNLASSLCALAALSVVAHADVITVDASGGGDFTTLTAAVAAALDGDTLLVAEGFYAEPGQVVIAGKGLTIVGERPSSGPGIVVEVQPGLEVRNLPGGHAVVLQNLRVYGTPGTTSPATPALVVHDTLGHVRVQDCVLLGGGGASNAHPDGATGVVIVDAFQVAFAGSGAVGGPGRFSPDLSVVTGHGGTGLDVSGGQLVCVDGWAGGGMGGSNEVGGWPDGGDGGTGLRVDDTALYLAGMSVTGGDGGTAHHGGDGGDGLVVVAAAPTWLMSDSNASAGDGGFSDDGPDGAKGTATIDPFEVVVDLGGVLHGFSVDSPLRAGGIGTFDFGGQVGDTPLLLLSFGPHAIPLVGYEGALMLAPNGLVTVTLPIPGNLDVPFAAPALPVGLQAIDVYVQAAYLGVDGTKLGPGRVLTLLDAGF